MPNKLIPCPDCFHQISKTARRCPNCGKPVETTASSLASLFVGLVIGLVIAVVLLGSVWLAGIYLSAP